MSNGPLLVVTGTRREGALAAGPGVIVLAGGGDGARLAADLARLSPRACGIVSFGMGGALVAGLAIGDTVIGSGVVGAISAPCNPAWIDALRAALPAARVGQVFADGTLLASVAQKHAAAQSGALIADMESHLAGAAAAQAGLPFAIVRTTSDTFDAALPPAITVAMRPGGGVAAGAILASLLRAPGQTRALLRTGLLFRRGFARLATDSAAVSPRFRFDETPSPQPAPPP